MLLFIFMLLIILTFIWYFIVRDVPVEHFPIKGNFITIKFNDKYLEGHKNGHIVLGKNEALGIYQVHDLPEFDGIRLESNKYPGYFLSCSNNKWKLKSKFFIKNNIKSIFIPIGNETKIDDQPNISFINYSNGKCLEINDKMNVVAGKFNKKPTKSQTFEYVLVSHI